MESQWASRNTFLESIFITNLTGSRAPDETSNNNICISYVTRLSRPNLEVPWKRIAEMPIIWVLFGPTSSS